MTIAYFPGTPAADVIDVGFVDGLGIETVFPLMIDSGFTGQSAFVLAKSASNVALGSVLTSQITGALQGLQQRIVSWRIGSLCATGVSFAILADLAPLTLPAGVQGIAGLAFLRQFQRWGGQRIAAGVWQFFLET